MTLCINLSPQSTFMVSVTHEGSGDKKKYLFVAFCGNVVKTAEASRRSRGGNSSQFGGCKVMLMLVEETREDEVEFTRKF
jgi:hypothetical protein